jgi:predicted P-loop ATPase
VMAVTELPDVSLRIFPLHGILPGPACTCSLGAECGSIGKHPMVPWRNYEDNAKGPSGGYGIQTGSFNNVFAVDLDKRPNKDGITAFTDLAQGRPIPDTSSVITPSGGVHLYFRLPPNVFIPSSRGVLGTGIDIKGEGGYVVGPGSPHKNGGIYQEVPHPLADAPQWLLDLIVKEPKPPKPLTSEHRTVDPSSPEGVRAIEWVKAKLLAAEPAIQGQGGSNCFFTLCWRLMISALPLDVLRQLIEEIYNPRCQPPWSGPEIEHKLEDADLTFNLPRGLPSPDFFDQMRGRTKDTDAREPDPTHEYTFEVGMRSGAETQKASLGEVTADLFDHVDWAGVLMFDDFRDRILAVNPPMRMDAEGSSGLSNNDVQLVRIWLEYHGKKCNTQDVGAAIEAVARQRKFNPLQDWLKSLEWDTVHRLDRVLPEYFRTPDGPYELAIGPRWFISLVARAMTPGCQSDCTLILEGPQGIGKTSAFRALMPDPTWYADSTAGVDSKDFYENLRGVWLMGFDELDSLTKASLTKVKNVLTSTSDRFRQSYGRSSTDHPRVCGFCGSTNAKQYFNDPSGARRFWPVRVLREIDRGRITEDRDQLWAEAFARWHAEEVWHVDTQDLRALCEAEQEARLEIDGREELILRWFNDPAKFSRNPVTVQPNSVFKGGAQPFDGSQGVTTADVLEHTVGKLKGQWTTGDTMRIGKILQHRLKMKRSRVRIGKNLEWRYLFPDA